MSGDQIVDIVVTNINLGGICKHFRDLFTQIKVGRSADVLVRSFSQSEIDAPGQATETAAVATEGVHS